jgi:hypothetical protein
MGAPSCDRQVLGRFERKRPQVGAQGTHHLPPPDVEGRLSPSLQRMDDKTQKIPPAHLAALEALIEAVLAENGGGPKTEAAIERLRQAQATHGKTMKELALEKLGIRREDIPKMKSRKN